MQRRALLLLALMALTLLACQPRCSSKRAPRVRVVRVDAGARTPPPPPPKIGDGGSVARPKRALPWSRP